MDPIEIAKATPAIRKAKAEPKQNGGRRKGAGRPALGHVAVLVRLTPEQAAKLKALGGSAWLRELLARL